MALSDSDKFKHATSQRRRAISAPTNKHWSDSQKIEAVQTYLALGEVRLTAAVLKIPEITLHNWKAKDWWKDIERELRNQEDMVLSAKLQNIYNKSMEVVADRLEHGDYIYDQKTGSLVRKPVAMKDAHKVTMDMIEKREILVNKVPVTQTLEAVEDKLAKLAEKFAEMAKQPKQIIEVTDVIVGSEQPDAATDVLMGEDIAVYEEVSEREVS